MNKEWLTGYNCIKNSLGSMRRKQMELFYVENTQDPQQRIILKECTAKGIPTSNKYSTKKLAGFIGHNQSDDYVQSKMALRCTPYRCEHWSPILLTNGKPIWLALHHIQDPQNLGAIIRTGYFYGVGGILMTEKNSASPSPTVSRSSAGSMEVAPLYSVGSMCEALGEFRRAGFKVICTGPQRDSAVKREIDEKLKESGVVLVVGNEKVGLPSKFDAICDEWMSIKGGDLFLDSLNVSVATGILLSKLSN